MKEDHVLRKHSQALRKEATKEERLLWNHFLKRYEMQFRRQCVFGEYIVDFYCAKARLVVELDGSQHYDPAVQEYDKKRTAYLETLQLQVLRFSNLDVLQHFDSICQTIDMVAKSRFMDGPTPIEAGRRALSNTYYSRVRSPHPPPTGAPSPQGEGIYTGGTMSKFEFAVPTLFGLEGIAGDELRRLDLENVRVENGRVLFSGDETALARASINLRTGERLLIVLADFPAKTFEELFQGV